jgi:hypothetical protein
MTPDTLAIAHGAPSWSPFAIAVGLICGFLLGAICVGVYALRLHRRPDPAWDAEAIDAIDQVLQLEAPSHG